MIGDAFRPTLTLDGLRNLLQDMRTAGKPMPKGIMVSERERRDLNQEILGASRETVARDDQRPEHDGQAIGVIEGVWICSHPDVPNGKARLIY